MHRRQILVAGLVALVATPAWAAEDSGKPDLGQFVRLSPVALPIVVDGRLANYIFITVKILLTPQANATALQDKEPYFRDALVRAAHRSPFVLRNDYNRVDEAKLKSTLYRDAVAIAGPGKILSVVIVEQTPQHNLPKPHQASAPAPSLPIVP